jgi:hypothetical protein
MKPKNSDKPFPSLPPDSAPYLASLKGLSDFMIREGGDIDKVRHSAVFFMFLSNAPVEHEYGYFKMYQKMAEKCGENIDHYNHYIFRQGQDYALETLNKEIGDLAPFFNQFQIVMWGINERAKVDPAWHPLNTLVWGWYTSLYSAKRHDSFMNKFISSIEECQNEEDEEFGSHLN